MNLNQTIRTSNGELIAALIDGKWNTAVHELRGCETVVRLVPVESDRTVRLEALAVFLGLDTADREPRRLAVAS